jgi:hypothetical protein
MEKIYPITVDKNRLPLASRPFPRGKIELKPNRENLYFGSLVSVETQYNEDKYFRAIQSVLWIIFFSDSI